MKSTFYLLLFFISITAYSQDAFDAVAKDACSCVESKKLDFAKEADIKSIQMSAGLCIIESYTAHINEIPEKERADFSDQAGMRQLGEKVAMRMMSFCPDVIMAMGRKYLDEKEAQQEVIEEVLTIEGKVTAIEVKQFVTFKVKDKNNRVHSLMILDYFDTASLYTENKIKVGDNLTVGYAEIELYDTLSKDFKYFKIISSLEKK